jgi:tetratricopeptide (TPR) repeat protein
MAAKNIDDLRRHYKLLRSDPHKFMEIAEGYIINNPNDSSGYFTRHQGWMSLGETERALQDMDAAIALEPDSASFTARGCIYRHIGQYRAAIEDFNRAERAGPKEWEDDALGLFYRADCYARLGDEKAALADCARLRDDHWTPGPFQLPAGNKAEVAEALRRLAAASR